MKADENEHAAMNAPRATDRAVPAPGLDGIGFGASVTPVREGHPS